MLEYFLCETQILELQTTGWGRWRTGGWKSSMSATIFQQVKVDDITLVVEKRRVHQGVDCILTRVWDGSLLSQGIPKTS